MKYQNNFIKILLILVLSFPYVLQGPTAIPVAYAATPPTCDQLGMPDKTNNWIVTITEENISNATSQANIPGSHVLTCFRVNKTEGSSTTSTYAETCIPGATVNCQRIQVLLAQSGADLLYTYIGLIYRWAAGTIGIVSVLFLVLGGIEISIAQGDSGKIEKAKERIMQSLAGLVLLFLSGLLLYTINPNFFTQ